MFRLILFLLIFSTYAFNTHARESSYEQQKVIQDSCLNYELLQDSNRKVYVITINEDRCHPKLVKALEGGIGRESVLSISKRHKAAAAVNAGFFEAHGTRNGNPSGIFINEQNIFALSGEYPLLYIKNGKINIHKSKVTPFIKDKDSIIPISSINTKVSNGLTVYGKHWHTHLDDTSGILVKNGKSVSYSKNLIGTKLDQNSFIISSNDNNTNIDQFRNSTNISFGVKIDDEIIDPKHVSIVSGSNILLENGKILEELTKLKSDFAVKKHARTAICTMNSGEIGIFVNDSNHGIDVEGTALKDVIDKLSADGYTKLQVYFMRVRDIVKAYDKANKDSELSYGMPLIEFADFLRKRGCVNAINLDGGSSSTLVMHGKILNYPHGKMDIKEQSKYTKEVSNAIIFKQKF